VRGATGATLSHTAVSHFCEVFRAWSSLVTAEAVGRVEASNAHRAAAHEGAKRILSTLAHLADRFPAVPIRVNRQLELVTLWNKGPTGVEALPVQDDRIARFAGVREPDEDVNNWMAQRRREEHSLAVELSGLGAEHGVTEFRRLLTEAQVLEGHHGGEFLAALLAEHVADPENWLRAAVHEGIRSIVGPMLAKARTDQVDVDAVVRYALGTHELRDVALRAFFHETAELDPLARSVLATLREGDAASIEDLWAIDTDTPMLRALLVHPLKAIRSVAAVAFGEGLDHGPQLPDALRGEWRAALLEANPNELPQHSRWRLEQMLEHAVKTDPELCADWFIADAEMSGRSYRVRRSLELRSDILRSMPREQKRRVCAALSADTLIQSGFASDLLGSDEGLAGELLTDGVVDVKLLLRSLSGYRDHTVEGLAPVLFAAGVDPDVIAAKTLGARETVGSVAESVRGDLRFYADLAERRPELGEVCEAASARLRIELDEALAEERMERLHGW
jgi:hypothetical protein